MSALAVNPPCSFFWAFNSSETSVGNIFLDVNHPTPRCRYVLAPRMMCPTKVYCRSLSLLALWRYTCLFPSNSFRGLEGYLPCESPAGDAGQLRLGSNRRTASPLATCQNQFRCSSDQCCPKATGPFGLGPRPTQAPSQPEECAGQRRASRSPR